MARLMHARYTPAMTAPAEERRDRQLFALMLGVFLGGGLLASVEALLVPRLKLTLGLGYAQATTVQLAYYASYLLFAIPATMLAARIGAMRATAAGLAIIAAGCALVAWALGARGFAPMLAALLLVSGGATVLQIACNGVMATHGERGRAAARFTALQGFNSLGTVIGPLAAAWFLLGAGNEIVPFAVFAMGFGALAILAFGARDLLPRDTRDAAPHPARIRTLLGEPRTAGGALAIFAYVGAEVTIGTLLVTYLMLPPRGGLSALAAGRLVSLYWAGAMAGRFAGAWALRRMAAPRLLAGASVLALALVAVAILPFGIAGGVALLGVGIANAIMFPTIFALAMPGDPADVPAASMLLCMAVVGGAVVPYATGRIADAIGLSLSFALPFLCYAGILAFALSCRPGAARP